MGIVFNLLAAGSFAFVSGMNMVYGNYWLSFVFICCHVYFSIAAIGSA